MDLREIMHEQRRLAELSVQKLILKVIHSNNRNEDYPIQIRIYRYSGKNILEMTGKMLYSSVDLGIPKDVMRFVSNIYQYLECVEGGKVHEIFYEGTD